MRFNDVAQIAALAVLSTLTSVPVGAWPHKQGQKVRVRFLATSTIIRSTWYWNEDTYLAELSIPRSSESILVRVVDEYPNEAPPLSRGVLTAASGTVLRVKRDTSCERRFGEILLRTAPADPMSILPERLGYQPPLDRTPAPGTVLPCYRTVRR